MNKSFLDRLPAKLIDEIILFFSWLFASIFLIAFGALGSKMGIPENICNSIVTLGVGSFGGWANQAGKWIKAEKSGENDA
jgi:small basic protein